MVVINHSMIQIFLIKSTIIILIIIIIIIITITTTIIILLDINSNLIKIYVITNKINNLNLLKILQIFFQHYSK